MENSPISSSVSPLTQAAKILLLQQGAPSQELEALLKQGIQTLSLRLIEQLPTGVRLQLPNGQSFVAQGKLPFPVGSELVCKMESQASQIKLQTLEAKPPATPVFLAPLNKSEAQSLLNRLTPYFDNPSTQLTPPNPQGQTLSQALSPNPSQTPSQTLSQTLSPTLPQTATTPPNPKQGALPQPPSQQTPPQPELTSAQTTLRTSVQPTTQTNPNVLITASQIGPSKLAQLASTGPLPEAKSTQGQMPDSDLLEALSHLSALQLSTAPTALKGPQQAPLEALAKLFVFLKSQGEEILPKLPIPHSPQSTHGQTTDKTGLSNLPTPNLSGKSTDVPLAPSQNVASTENPHAIAARAELLSPKIGPDVPSLSAFLKGATQALAHPGLSPEEAPFHALQAKEGTAYFEIPIPWASASPMQWWVESDSDSHSGSSADPSHRMLLSLHFSGLGDTRVGFQYTSGQLAIRIWTEHPDALLQRQKELEAELQEFNPKTTVTILPLGQGEHLDVRALIKGSASGQSSDWRAMA